MVLDINLYICIFESVRTEHAFTILYSKEHNVIIERANKEVMRKILEQGLKYKNFCSLSVIRTIQYVIFWVTSIT